MFSIVIVDDEPWIAKGIEKSCNWESYGAKVVHVTSDPESALDYILDNKPDIVFTDINMENISGIDLIKQARINGVCSEFVIISGYSDFEYARSAVKYGAYYYMLKPVDKEELKSIMSNLVIHLKTKSEGDSAFEYIENLLVNTKISTHRALFQHFNIKHSYEGFQTLIIDGNLDQEILEHVLDGVNYVKIELGQKKACYFLNTDHDLDSNSALGKLTWAETVIGLSCYYNEDIPPNKVFLEADLALHDKFIYKDKCFFKYKRNNNQINLIIKDLADCFTHVENVLPYITNFTKHAADHHMTISEITLLYNFFAITFSYLYMEYERSYEFMQKTYDELYAEYKDIDDLKDYLYEVVGELLKDKSINRDKLSHTKFEQILDYVNDHYTENIFLSDLADKFYYNQTYISDLIKRNLGKTLTEYILELRIKKACHLLSHTNDPISDIATHSGYNDYCYFTKQFKKVMGMTPRGYRKVEGEQSK